MPDNISVHECVSVEYDHHPNRYRVVLWEQEGNQAILFVGTRTNCEAMAHKIAETMGTWPGFEWDGVTPHVA